MLDKMHRLCTQMQAKIILALEAEETTQFRTDAWQRPGGGGGITRVLEEGSVIEKGGVNTSYVHGQLKGQEVEMFKTLVNRVAPDMTASLENAHFAATGISLVIHPKNPFIPTTHANYRYFELIAGKERIWWFGGGADLTPYYLDEDDARHFHQMHKNACDTLSPTTYDTYKKECDTYFYLPHRGETRGVGGIFFDYLRQYPQETLHDFAESCADALIKAYIPIIQKHKNRPYTDEQRDWQLYRRGRYVEFNLLYDRGTLFGIKTHGRTESILMSLPNLVSWKYNYTPKSGSPEDLLTQCLKSPREWI